MHAICVGSKTREPGSMFILRASSHEYTWPSKRLNAQINKNKAVRKRGTLSRICVAKINNNSNTFRFVFHKRFGFTQNEYPP